MDLYLDTTIGQLPKIRTPRRRKNWADELWKLATAYIALQLVLAQKSELSFNDWDLFPQAFHRSISNKSRSFMLCEKKPALA